MSITLRPYPEYKDSGLPWVGEIPAHWDVRRNGRLFTQRVETGFPDLPVLEVSLKTGVRVRDMDSGARKQIMSDFDKYKRAALGDVTYNMMRMWQGAVGLAPTDGLVSPAYVVARPYPEVESRYYSYLFRTSAYMNGVNKFSRGIVTDRNRLYWEEFKQMPSVFPPFGEQWKIASFLDYHGHSVSRLIRTKQQFIDLLNEQKQAIIQRAVTRGLDPDAPTKSTGLDWLPEVPEHWEVKPLKSWAAINSRALPETTDPEYLFQYLDIGAVGTGFLTEQPELMKFENAPSRARRVLRRGDTIISTVRTYLKAVYFVADEREDLVASTGFAALTPVPAVVPEYLSFVIQSNTFVERVMANSVGIAYPAIAETRLGALHLALPPTEREQLSLVEYIKGETQDIDEVICRAQREINLIREYRTRLISDVVTGRLDVRGVELPELGTSEESAGTSPNGLESIVAGASPNAEEVRDAGL